MIAVRFCSRQDPATLQVILHRQSIYLRQQEFQKCYQSSSFLPSPSFYFHSSQHCTAIHGEGKLHSMFHGEVFYALTLPVDDLNYVLLQVLSEMQVLLQGNTSSFRTALLCWIQYLLL